MVHEFTLLNRSWFALKKVHKDKKVLFVTLGIQLDVILEIKQCTILKTIILSKEMSEVSANIVFKRDFSKNSFGISSGCVIDPLKIANLTLDIL